MAVSYVWPVTLPQSPRRAYGETTGVLIARTPMDRGPAKHRRLGAMPATMSVSFTMSTAQIAILETFVLTTLMGTARFGFPHPRTGSQIEARIVPGGDGKLYDTAHVGSGVWVVSMTIEVLP